MLLGGVILGLGIFTWKLIPPSLVVEPTDTEVEDVTEEPSEVDTTTEERVEENIETEQTSTCPETTACEEEAQTLCPDAWSGTDIQASWKLDLVRCLYDDHRDELSDECLESLECRQALNEALITQCADDKQKFCSGILPAPGSEPLVDCLGEHFDELSEACATAWTNHDNAKPN